MFDDRDNLVGVLLLGVCGVVAGILIYAIVTGQRLRFSGPGWLGPILLIVMLGLLGYGFFSSGGFRRFGRGSQWPIPAPDVGGAGPGSGMTGPDRESGRRGTCEERSWPLHCAA
jgi:hypothetical protein